MLEVLHTGLLFPSQPSTTRAITCLASPVRAEESSQEVLHTLFTFPRIFLQPSEGTGRRNRCKRFFTPDCCFRPSVQQREPYLSLISGPGRGKASNKFFTPYSFFRGYLLQPSEDTGRRNRCKSSSHRIVVSVPAFNDENHQQSLISGYGGGKACNKFFTPYLFFRGFFSSL